ncbi:GntR family transcriptional regulator [Microbacter sp. GSS18]|nr:GntR family transcriptional regulator [Microbacter sp. GSS18]
MIDEESADELHLTGGDLVYNALRSRIVSGELPPKTVLRAQALAEEFGTSRTPVREALRRLAETGLVEYVPNRGATVIGFTPEQIVETYFVRAALESRAAGLATGRLNDEDLVRLSDLIEEMDGLVNSDDAADLRRLGELNERFHRTILVASGNSQLVTVVESVTQAPLMIRGLRQYGASFRARSNHQHRDILTALQTRDALWAEVAMRSHVLAARNAAMTAVDASVFES